MPGYCIQLFVTSDGMDLKPFAVGIDLRMPRKSLPPENSI